MHFGQLSSSLKDIGVPFFDFEMYSKRHEADINELRDKIIENVSPNSNASMFWGKLGEIIGEETKLAVFGRPGRGVSWAYLNEMATTHNRFAPQYNRSSKSAHALYQKYIISEAVLEAIFHIRRHKFSFSGDIHQLVFCKYCYRHCYRQAWRPLATHTLCTAHQSRRFDETTNRTIITPEYKEAIRLNPQFSKNLRRLSTLYSSAQIYLPGLVVTETQMSEPIATNFRLWFEKWCPSASSEFSEANSLTELLEKCDDKSGPIEPRIALYQHYENNPSIASYFLFRLESWFEASKNRHSSGNRGGDRKSEKWEVLHQNKLATARNNSQRNTTEMTSYERNMRSFTFTFEVNNNFYSRSFRGAFRNEPK